MRKLATGIALTAGLLGGAAGTAAFAPAIATAVTSGSTDAVTERVEEIKDALAALVDDGTLTQSQADEVAQTLGESDLALGGRHHGPRAGHLDPEQVAEILGMTVEELKAAADDEQTLAEIAEAQGVSRTDLIDKLVAAAKTELDEEVAEGDLTQEEADALEGELTERVTAMIDRAWGGHGRGGRGFGRDGADSDGDADESPSASPTPGTAS